MDALITANQGDLGAFFSPTAPIYEPDSRKTDGSGGKVRSVDVWDMRCYKPSFLAYKQFEESVSALEKDCVLVTSHPWDVVGAKNAGWRVIWVDREGGGWIDGLGRGMGVAPDFVVATLDEMGDLWEKL